MSRKFNPEILTMARGARGATQAGLCTATGWPQSKVSKLEHGLAEPTEEEVAQLAAILEFPVSFFYHDAMPYGFGSCCLHHRKRTTTPLKALNRLHDEINVRRIQISRLLGGVTLAEPKFPLLDVADYESPEQIAQLVRATWQLPRGPIRNLVSTIEAAGGLVLFIDLETPKIDAVSQRAPGIPPLFFLDAKKPVDRYRFTLAHELGHIVMHGTPSPNAEEEADKFASEFLMPAHEIQRELTNLDIAKAANLKLKWRVSMQALIRRARDLGAINESRYKSLCVRISQLGYRKSEPNELPPEQSILLRSIVQTYLSERDYTVAELGDAMFCREEELRRVFLQESAVQHLRLVQ